MHPSLLLSNIEDLPLQLRIRARGAANGSEKDRSYLAAKVQSTSLPDSTLVKLLPLFYRDLDTAGIATLRRLDGEAGDVRRQIGRVLNAIAFLITLDEKRLNASDAWNDIWMRTHQWIVFIETFREHLPIQNLLRVPSHPDKKWLGIYMQLVGIIWCCIYGGPADLVSRIVLSRDIFGFLMNAWAEILDAAATGLVPNTLRGLYSVSSFLVKLKIEAVFAGTPEARAQLLNLGANSAHLATLCVAHTEICIANVHSPLLVSGEQNQWSWLVAGLAHVLAPTLNSNFREQLKRAGMVPRLAALCHTLQVGPPFQPQFNNIPSMLISVLASTLHFTPKPRYIAEALRADLLPALLAYEGGSQHITAEAVAEVVLPVVSRDLPSHSILRSVIREFGSALAKLDASSPGFQFNHTQLQKSWQETALRFSIRSVFVDDYESTRKDSPRACNYDLCGQLHAKKDMKRCTGCLVTIYCSRICQKHDWRSGHRSSCPEWRILRRRDAKLFTKSDYTFLRALVFLHYSQRKEFLALEFLRFYNRDSPAFPFLKIEFEDGALLFPVAEPVMRARLLGEDFRVIPRLAIRPERVQVVGWTLSSRETSSTIDGLLLGFGKLQKLWVRCLRIASPSIWSLITIVFRIWWRL
ncbi:hypothetical protein C8F01DRAFT_1232634 [Mycena amicta]|nr:hypothetical protein C8F01DRAFT_1232634 [Mycena amicta]